MPRKKNAINALRFSNKIVAEVLNVSVNRVAVASKDLEIKTGGHGYSADDVKRIRSYIEVSKGRDRKSFGTADELRSALATI